VARALLSGAIGKANRLNYQFKTPVATIGIRGTDYSTTLNNGEMLVTVNKGGVNVGNDIGDANVQEGESYAITSKSSPERYQSRDLEEPLKHNS
jgi:hypothetical protein